MLKLAACRVSIGFILETFINFSCNWLKIKVNLTQIRPSAWIGIRKSGQKYGKVAAIAESLCVEMLLCRGGFLNDKTGCDTGCQSGEKLPYSGLF
jgi:hypothetical protein